jgi:hypothetical protein
MIRSLARAGGQVSLGLATNIFLAAFIYLSLMVLAMRAAAMITGSLRLGSESGADDAARDAATGQQVAGLLPPPAAFAANSADAAAPTPDERVRELVRSLNTGAPAVAANDVAPAQADRRTVIVPASLPQLAEPAATPDRDPRVRSLGQGFRAPQRAQS